MTNRPAIVCAHALADGDPSRCVSSLGPHTSREQILTFERENQL